MKIYYSRAASFKMNPDHVKFCSVASAIDNCLSAALLRDLEMYPLGAILTDHNLRSIFKLFFMDSGDRDVSYIEDLPLFEKLTDRIFNLKPNLSDDASPEFTTSGMMMDPTSPKDKDYKKYKEMLRDNERMLEHAKFLRDIRTQRLMEELNETD